MDEVDDTDDDDDDTNKHTEHTLKCFTLIPFNGFCSRISSKQPIKLLIIMGWSLIIMKLPFFIWILANQDFFSKR